MKIAEVSKQTGLSIATIRFYEKLKLCPPIKRGEDGKRRFSPKDLDWLTLLASLRATGMPQTDMRAFAALYQLGDQTVPQRKAALLKHQETLDAKQAELNRCREILNRKLAQYDEIERRRS